MEKHLLVRHLRTQCIQEGRIVRLIFLSHISKYKALKGHACHHCSPAYGHPQLLPRLAPKSSLFAAKGREGREKERKL